MKKDYAVATVKYKKNIHDTEENVQSHQIERQLQELAKN